MPVPKPRDVVVALSAGSVRVQGPKGVLERAMPPLVRVEDRGDHLAVVRLGESSRHRAMHGLARSLVANMVTGVAEGFDKRLRLVGNGYRAHVRAKVLELEVGLSHAAHFPIPEGIAVTIGAPESLREGNQTVQHIPITVTGADKERVGETAAEIRRIKKPEVYEPSKGIRYEGERVRLLPKKARA
jgi:large subunit ribosomal protein L6